MWRASPLLLLCAGCPYIFTEPDLSRVPGPRPDGPGGTTGDTAPVPTGDTAPVLDGPVVTEILARPLYDALELFVSFDPPGALDTGGMLHVRAGDIATYDLSIPGDVALASPSQVRWTLPVQATCDGVQLTVEAAVTDSLGARGAGTVTEIVLPAGGRIPEQQGAFDVGEIELPILICGDSDTGGDPDRVRFTVGVAAEVLFVLSWEEALGGDIDFDVFAPPGGPYVAGSAGFANPEVDSGVLLPATSYDLTVRHYSGPPPIEWQVALLPIEVQTTPTTPGTGDTGP